MSVMINYLDALEKKLSSHVKDAKKRKKNAKKTKVEHYFAGQYDAFNQVLMELKISKYEQENHTEETPVIDETPAIEATPVVASELSNQNETPEVIAEVPTPSKKPRKRKKAAAEELSPAMIAAKELLQQAVQAGVITQKISLYRHEDFPNGFLRGRKPVMEFLLGDEALAGKITQQIAEKQAA